MGGYMGRLLFVNLSTAEIQESSYPEDWQSNYIGGYGVGARVLYERMAAGVDPLGPQNVLGFLTGPLTGTRALIGSRFTVVGKSPLTGGWGDANCGGHFGPALKAAGYDGVFIVGQAQRPVVLVLDEGRASLVDAGDLWGKDVYETDDALKQRFGNDAQIACIGPAGENLSLISAIMTDKSRAAARSGLGAVMGSKRLKAVVARGRASVPVADPETLAKIREKYLPQVKSGFAKILSEYGTSGTLEDAVQAGDAPIKNWAGTPLEFPTAEKIGGPALKQKVEKRYACHGCPIGCGGWVRVQGSDGKSWLSRKVEYETLGAFGTMCLNDDLDSIIMANDICNRYGLDTISVGCTVAFAIECFENGLITPTDTDGLTLTWGDGKAIVELTERIAKRSGIGNLLADGSFRAAKKIGGRAAEFAIQVGGQEVPMHDPRWCPGLLTTYVTDATPARHTQGSEAWLPPGVQDPGIEMKQQSGRGKIHSYMVNLYHAMSCAGLCLFGFFCVDVQSIPEFLSAVTGKPVTMEGLLLAGERIATLRHAFNLREGINFLEFEIPKRLLGQPPLPAGPTAGVTLSPEVLIGEYLDEVGWDRKTLRPRKERLVALGLADLIGEFGD